MTHTSKIKYTNLHIILCQVIIHHNHNLLIWDPILVDNLVCMTCISLEKKRQKLGSVVHFNSLDEHFSDASPHLVPVVIPAIGAGYDHHPVFSTVRLLGGKRLYQAETHPEQHQQR